jgi:hypothetical protein
MKKLLSLLFALGLTLSACGPAQTQSAPPAQTSTLTLSPTITQTPISPTATVTPLPTIPTFTPTFDASTIVTVTPGERAECPIENPNLVPDLKLAETNACIENAIKNLTDPSECANQNIDNEILGYLNQGGSIDKLTSYLAKFGQIENATFTYKDLTGDNVPELIFHDSNQRFGGYYFYSCNSGKYNIQYIFGEGDDFITIFTVQDLNADGINEIIFKIQNVLIVLSWNTYTYNELAGIRFQFGEQYQIIDINNDGIMEIILSGISQPYWEPHDVMWRQYSAIYSWNGLSYDLSMKVFENPIYRFQAIQDADFALSQNEFDNALNLFEEAISNNKNLKSFSPEIKMNLQEAWAARMQDKPIPTSIPEDPTEYPRLAAYAYYRIMLLHLVQGGEPEAASTYQTLQETFGADPYAAPYVEMASAFWEAYHSTQKMYDGCAAAIQYAVEHPEILVPLGSDYHGWQSHIYEPADVCPFR